MRRISFSLYGSVSDGRSGGRRSPGWSSFALTEVEAAGQLADDQQVHAVEELRAERRGVDERGLGDDRTQVGEEAEFPAGG